MALDFNRLADLARAEAPGLLFVTVSGAHLYGFPSADSDVDLRGCYAAPLTELIGMRPPTETRQRSTLLDGVEVDLVVHEAAKYCRLLCRHNGYVLEQIFSPLVVLGQEFLDRLRPLARGCVTRHCYNHYRGFLHSQLQLLEKQEVKKAKSLLYAYRVVMTGVHLLETGEIQADLTVLNRRFGLAFIDDLIQRKASRELGGLPALDWSAHRTELGRWEDRLAQAFAASTLPEEPAWEPLNRFLIGLRLPTDAARENNR
jgi:predicted nucleotidyltransferase